MKGLLHRLTGIDTLTMKARHEDRLVVPVRIQAIDVTENLTARLATWTESEKSPVQLSSPPSWAGGIQGDAFQGDVYRRTWTSYEQMLSMSRGSGTVQKMITLIMWITSEGGEGFWVGCFGGRWMRQVYNQAGDLLHCEFASMTHISSLPMTRWSTGLTRNKVVITEQGINASVRQAISETTLVDVPCYCRPFWI